MLKNKASLQQKDLVGSFKPFERSSIFISKFRFGHKSYVSKTTNQKSKTSWPLGQILQGMPVLGAPDSGKAPTGPSLETHTVLSLSASSSPSALAWFFMVSFFPKQSGSCNDFDKMQVSPEKISWFTGGHLYRHLKQIRYQGKRQPDGSHQSLPAAPPQALHWYQIGSAKLRSESFLKL